MMWISPAAYQHQAKAKGFGHADETAEFNRAFG
jgi:hypothetical protein